MEKIAKQNVISVLFSLSLLLILTPFENCAGLDLPLQYFSQQHSNWCWAATSQSVLNYYSMFPNQCTIANMALYHQNSLDCCDGIYSYSAQNFCNLPIAPADIKDYILTPSGLSSSFDYSLPWADCVIEINSGRPFYIIIAFTIILQTNVTGHVVLVRGYNLNNQYIDYIDPDPAVGDISRSYYYILSHTITNDSGTIGLANWAMSLKLTTDTRTACYISNATNILVSGATLNGTVNTNNLSTSIYFQYGTTAAYELGTIAADQSPLTSTTPTPVSKSINNLTPGSLYHFRIKAVNSTGTSYSGDNTFSTTPAFALAVIKAGTGKGKIISSPTGISCSGSCSAYFPAGASIILMAMPDPGNIFTGWSGACSGKSPTCTVTMNANTSVTATFVPDITPIIMMLLD